MPKPLLIIIAITFSFNVLLAQSGNLCDSIKALYNKTFFEGGKIIKVSGNLYVISLAKKENQVQIFEIYTSNLQDTKAQVV